MSKTVVLPQSDSPTVVASVSFWQAFRFWLKLGFISFGGPAGQIAMMHQELVDNRRWISEGRFLHALNFCMVLPGPEAQQLATYIGWLMHKTWGGVIAGVLFILPSLALLIALAWIYLVWGDVAMVAGIFYGIKPAVAAIVLQAAHRIGSRALKNGAYWAIAAAAFVAIFALNVPFPLIVLTAAIVGFIGGRMGPAAFGNATQMSWFFTKAALMTFGGAYAVLPYVYQGAVTHYGWLTAGQMMDGLALGESTPGPLIMVVTFVGFVGGYTKAVLGVDDVLLGGIAAACLVTWFTFLPSFIFILAGGPFIETTHNKVGFTAPLTAITAAVVGVILNLALFFIWHSVWGPSGFDPWSAAIALAAAGLLFRYKWKLTWVLAAAAAVGLIVHMAGLSGAG